MSKKNNTGRKAHFTNSAAPGQRELTIYNSGFGVVQESRSLELDHGSNQVQLDGMPTQYYPNSLLLVEAAGEGDLTLGAVSYRPANLNSNVLLAKSVGQKITVRLRNASGKQSVISGKLLALAGNKLIVELSPERTWVGDASDDVEIGKIPEGLSNSAALVVEVEASAAGVYAARLLYQAGGLSWEASHKAVYDDQKGLLSRFESWVSVTNGSGTSFDDATLKLLAGDIGQQDGRESFALAAAAPMGGGRAMKQASVRNARFESVGEQKLYVVEGKVSLSEGENKQVPLFSASDIPVEREYYLPYGPARQHGPEDESLKPVSIKLRLVNNEDSKLGKPIPAGSVSIYQPDSSGALQLTGTTSVDHVADGERFELEMGCSSDIKADRRLVDLTEDPEEEDKPESPRTVRPLGGPEVGMPRNPADMINHGAVEGEESEEEKPRYRTEARAVTVYNFKTEREVVVNVYDEFPADSDVKIEGEHKFQSKTATTHFAPLTVPAKGKVVLTYTLKYRIN